VIEMVWFWDWESGALRPVRQCRTGGEVGAVARKITSDAGIGG
jgi:hypothetical protein